MSEARELPEVDPFDLPEWLGETEVGWSAIGGIHGGHHVRGVLEGAGQRVACDLLAVDEAYPRPVATDATRVRAHQTWRHGEVLLVRGPACEERSLTLAVPGHAFTADLVLDAVARLAKAVGASPSTYVVSLRLGG